MANGDPRDALHPRDLHNLDRRLDDKIVVFAAQVGGLERLVDARLSEVNTKIAAQADKVELALTASDKAILKAETATEKRFDAVNEFRATLADQASNFLNKGEYSANHEALRDRVDAATSRLSTLEGRLAGYSAAAAVIAIVTAILLKFVQ